jgi:hypothetical protein
MDEFYKMVRQFPTLTYIMTIIPVQFNVYVKHADDMFAVQREPDHRHGWRNRIWQDYTVSLRPRETLSCPSFLKP